MPTATNYASELVNNVVGGFNGFLTGAGTGVTEFFKRLFLATEIQNGELVYTGGVSVFAIVSFICIGLFAAMALARWLIRKVG